MEGLYDIINVKILHFEVDMNNIEYSIKNLEQSIRSMEESNHLDLTQIKGIVDEYIAFKEDDILIDVGLLDLDVESGRAKSIKLGNVFFHLKQSLSDILGLITDISVLFNDAGIDVKKNVLLILKLILKLNDLITITIEESHAIVLSALYLLGAGNYPVSIDQLTSYIRRSKGKVIPDDIEPLLDDLVCIRCIKIEDAKVSITERIINDWIVKR